VHTKTQFELRFGMGRMHEEISDLFATVAFELAQRLPDGLKKDQMLMFLDKASVCAHDALVSMYPEITEIKEPANETVVPYKQDKAINWKKLPQRLPITSPDESVWDGMRFRLNEPVSTEPESPSDGG